MALVNIFNSKMASKIMILIFWNKTINDRSDNMRLVGSYK